MRWGIARAAARAALNLAPRAAAPSRPGQQVFRADSSNPAAFVAAVRSMKGRPS